MTETTGPPATRPATTSSSPMVLVPHITGMLHPQTRAWAEAQSVPVAQCELPATDQFAYGELLHRHWNGLADLIVIEQDVVPPHRALEQFGYCPMPWCTHPYLIESGLHEMVLGCTRFSAKLQKAYPHLMWHAARNLGGMRQPTPWWTLNEQIIRYLSIQRIPVHPHTPPATHLHTYGDAPSG